MYDLHVGVSYLILGVSKFLSVCSGDVNRCFYGFYGLGYSTRTLSLRIVTSPERDIADVALGEIH